MRKRLKKLLSLTLAASLVLSLNTVAFAEEMIEDTVIAEAVDSDTVGNEGSETSDFEVSDEAGLDSVEEAVIDSYGNTDAEGSVDASVTNTVSDPSADPRTWSTDPYYARHTYGIYLPELFGYDDRDMISSDIITNGTKQVKPALTGYDLAKGEAFTKYGLLGTDTGKVAKVSFNCIDLGSGQYFIYAYGIANEFDYFDIATRNKDVTGDEKNALSRNNYYGMTPDDIPAGVFDYTRFTWNDKDGGSGANGSIIFEGAIINWTSGKRAEKNRIFKIDKLTLKNNLYATVSFDSVGGKWVKVSNKYQKSSKQPSFYPVLKVKGSYRDEKGDKIKPTKDEKKLVKDVNKKMKNSPIKFEIRRRPMAGTISENYTQGNDWKYTSLMGDDLDFKSNGKLKHATLQFKSVVSVKEKDADSDKNDKEGSDGSTDNTRTQVASYYLTHVLKMKRMKDGEFTPNLEETIKAGNFNFKTKTDSWYTTSSIQGYDTLIVFGANNMEGVAAFRKRKDTSVGNGYYKNANDMYISSVDETAEAGAAVEEAY